MVMRKLTRVVLGVALAAAPVWTFAQGIPVIDVANLVQAIQQVSAWGEQYSQMTQQLQQQLQQLQTAQSELQGMTGTRGLGTFANGIPVTGLVPSNVQSLLQGAQTPDALVSQVQSLVSGGMTNTQDRGAEIQTLMQEVNATTDPAGKAEMQARIAAENASVANDANRIALLKIQAQQQQQAIQNEIRDKNNQEVLQTAATVPNYSNVVGP